jgi:hypothetical protein
LHLLRIESAPPDPAAGPHERDVASGEILGVILQRSKLGSRRELGDVARDVRGGFLALEPEIDPAAL